MHMQKYKTHKHLRMWFISTNVLYFYIVAYVFSAVLFTCHVLQYLFSLNDRIPDWQAVRSKPQSLKYRF